MDAHSSDETLHSYLRKHFERMARKRARQLAEQTCHPGEEGAQELWAGTTPVSKLD
jgi:hypothetical protein